jgi:hypothetical protein
MSNKPLSIDEVEHGVKARIKDIIKWLENEGGVSESKYETMNMIIDVAEIMLEDEDFV